MTNLPSRKAPLLLLTGVALVLFKRAHNGKFGNQSHKVAWISSLVMGLLLRQVFAGTNKKYITNPKEAAGKESKEYDFIIVGGGTYPTQRKVTMIVLPRNQLCRHGWLRSCSAAFGGPFDLCFASGVGCQVCWTIHLYTIVGLNQWTFYIVERVWFSLASLSVFLCYSTRRMYTICILNLNRVRKERRNIGLGVSTWFVLLLEDAEISPTGKMLGGCKFASAAFWLVLWALTDTPYGVGSAINAQMQVPPFPIPKRRIILHMNKGLSTALLGILTNGVTLSRTKLGRGRTSGGWFIFSSRVLALYIDICVKIFQEVREICWRSRISRCKELRQRNRGTGPCRVFQYCLRILQRLYHGVYQNRDTIQSWFQYFERNTRSE